MKQTALLAATVATAFASLPLVNVAHADLALASAKGCTACHAMDKKILGPAYTAVAACYANKDAKKLAVNKTTLAKHIKEGGAGRWGPIPMPAHPAVADADVTKLVDWVVALPDGTCPPEFKGKL
jgi:cytochrome c